MSSPYLLPSGEDELTGACTFEDGLCAWTGRASYRWDPSRGWTSLSTAPATIDSGFELQSGVLAGADTHIGFLPSDGTDWAGWVDLSTFSDAHPMYGDLLLCIDASTETYVLLSVSSSGLDPVSTFSVDELADPVAGWTSPTNTERVLLLGDGGLWALDAPYTTEALQHLVSFDDVDLPALEDIPGPFQPGPATVVIPRRTLTALRLDLSDGTGHATGLAHLSGGTALWTAYLQDDRPLASRLLSALTALPAPDRAESFHFYDALIEDRSVQALATSAGLYRPGEVRAKKETVLAGTADDLKASPLDETVLATWGLWLGWEGTLESACRRLCNTADPDPALVESLRILGGREACEVLFDLLRGENPPTGPSGEYAFPVGALRALVAPFGEAVAPLVRSALTDASVPARVAACAAAGATEADCGPRGEDDAAPKSVLWTDDHPIPEDALRTNTTHDHPAVRAAARDTCARLSVEKTSFSPSQSR